MLDAYADLTPEEEAAITAALRHAVTPQLLRQAQTQDAEWRREKTAQKHMKPRRPPQRPRKVNQNE